MRHSPPLLQMRKYLNVLCALALFGKFSTISTQRLVWVCSACLSSFLHLRLALSAYVYASSLCHEILGAGATYSRYCNVDTACAAHAVSSAKRDATNYKLDDRSDQMYYGISTRTKKRNTCGGRPGASMNNILLLQAHTRANASQVSCLSTFKKPADPCGATIKSLGSCNIFRISRYSKGLDIP